ncbi:MAG TPA: DUF4397 domain-containing protein [Streptosporangiaceae bacterium]|nr:DUF4397 domain-containing protein [Streptosporangiaceae bacterium]
MTLRLNAPRRWRLRRHGSGGKGASRHGARLAMLLGAATLSLGTLTGTAVAAPASSMSSGMGWMRCAHLSPTAPVDIYLYSMNDPMAMSVLRHVAYGGVGMYMEMPAGEYTVGIRPAGASASTPPVLSASLMLRAGQAYTVAAMGPPNGVQLRTLNDRLTTPDGKSLVRVIQASLKQPHVTVRAGSATLASNLAFASVTPYGTDRPGQWMVDATGRSETWSGNVQLTAGSIHTLVVLDSSSGLKVADLMDAAGSAMMPHGGVATGLGGSVPGPAPSPLPWLAGLAGGLLVAAAAAIRLRRARAMTRHAR